MRASLNSRRWIRARGRQVLASACVAAALAAVLVACGSDAAGSDTGAGDASLRVVTTTALLADLAGEVAGEHADVRALIPAGVDLHAFEPPTEVARTVAEADLLIVNGYNLEASLLSVVLENRRDGTPLVIAAAGLEPLAGGHDHEGESEDEAHTGDNAALVYAEGDPHFWMDVANTMRYVENIRDALVDLDPEHAPDYRGRAEAYLAELRTLDDEVRGTLSAIPEDQRQLITFHNAYAYLARAYGLEMTATVLSAGANSEPSAADIANLIELVRREQVSAVFAEAEFDPRVLEVVAEETNASVHTIYNTLTDDVTTYPEMMRATAASLAEGLRTAAAGGG